MKLMQFPPVDEVPEMLRGKAFTIIQTAYLGNERDGAELIRPLTELGPDMNTFAMVEPSALSHLAMDPEDPVPYVFSGRLLSDVTDAGIDTLLESAAAAGPGLVMVELRGLGGALTRRPEGAGARATLDGDYLFGALAAVMDPAAYDEAAALPRGVSDAMTPWDAGIQYLNFQEQSVDARLFYDEDTWRLLRALRTEWDPNG